MRTEVQDLFHEVADLPVEIRARYFDDHGIDGATRRELEELLAFDSHTRDSLQHNIGRAAEDAMSDLQPPPPPVELLCGPYRLGRILGHGGMGSVYLAERVDGEVTQRVAIKLIQAGMNDTALRRHFLEERQILAGLSHPNVGRLLDAGHREDGLPYLVMEYIEGKPLDVYTAGLGIRQQIAVFLKVCAAVGYLHRNLVVHRDLKPGNILVTADGEPKILDFGIAKILGVPTDSAVTRLRILTPEYASPEQFAGRSVSTLADVYSLGAVLYRVMTGESPHPQHCNPDDQTASHSDDQFSPPAKFAPEFRGDLQYILMKAMRPEPRERYETVEQFAEDLENYLECRPLRARRGDTWYRARKFARRYRVFVAATVAVIVSLTAGLYIANRERTTANRRFSQLRQLSTRVIDLDRAIRTLPGSIDARERLVAASLAYLEGLARDTHGDRELSMEVADGYWRMARVQGVNAELNLGHTAEAEESLRKADLLIVSVLASRGAKRDALFRAALIAHDRMIVADTAGRHSDALKHARESVERLESLQREPGPPVKLDGFLRPGNPADAEKAGAGLLYGNISLGFVNAHQYEEGARYARRSADLVRGIPRPQMFRVKASASSPTLCAIRAISKAPCALSVRRVMSREKATYPSETARFFNRYALIHREGLILGEADAVNLERPEEAIAVLSQALNMAEEAAVKNPHDSASRGRVGTTARELGDILAERDPGQALAVFNQGIARLAEGGAVANNQRERAVLLAKSSYPLRRLGRTVEAKARIDDALAILKSTGNYPSQKIGLGSEPWICMSALADYTAAGNPRRALEIREQLLNAAMATHPDVFGDLRDVPKLAHMYEAIEGLSEQLGDGVEAARMKGLRIDLWRHWQQGLPQNTFVRRQLDAAVGPPSHGA